jgi:hypothetical protein
VVMGSRVPVTQAARRADCAHNSGTCTPSKHPHHRPREHLSRSIAAECRPNSLRGHFAASSCRCYFRPSVRVNGRREQWLTSSLPLLRSKNQFRQAQPGLSPQIKRVSRAPHTARNHPMRSSRLSYGSSCRPRAQCRRSMVPVAYAPRSLARCCRLQCRCKDRADG